MKSTRTLGRRDHVQQGVTLDGRSDGAFEVGRGRSGTGVAGRRSVAGLDDLFAAALAAAPTGAGVAAALRLAQRVGRATALPGRGRTADYFETLATLAAADVTVARVVEPHLDALAILDECPVPVDLAAIGADEASTWGVFAAEAAGVRLDAATDDGGWVVRGTKPWCSLAGDLTHALVTAHVDGDGGSARQLFAVALGQEGVDVHPEAWVSRGFVEVPSGPVDFADVRAVPVGEPGWYLERAGFEWGGIGVAACWFGGAVGVARRVLEAAGRKGDDVGALHAGRCASALFAARSALAAAAARIDEGGAGGRRDGGDDGDGSRPRGDGDGGDAGESLGGGDGTAAQPGRDDARILAQTVRAVVRSACDTVLHEAGQALGPAPLALDAAYAARVADLSLYLRQDHGARDEVRLGRLLVEESQRHAHPEQRGGAS
ncbi:acyl-CoA dehydrogenase [Herbiconiux liangxiaofengii]|uniref:acyl-CoA dehydrogenase n=1 Tax=Herbiconiux liangxiaofengii TaxID=3342795 RepID=UPI0035B85F1C